MIERFNVKRVPQRGATLIELIVSIVVISIGLAGILIVMDRNARASADPAIRYQAIAIAEAYLEEILLKSYNDPDGVGGESRAAFDDVLDYNGLSNSGARDQNDNAIAGLGQYVVGVQVTDEALNGEAARRVQVTVTPPFGDPVVLSGYRTNYF